MASLIHAHCSVRVGKMRTDVRPRGNATPYSKPTLQPAAHSEINIDDIGDVGVAVDGVVDDGKAKHVSLVPDYTSDTAGNDDDDGQWWRR